MSDPETDDLCVASMNYDLDWSDNWGCPSVNDGLDWSDDDEEEKERREEERREEERREEERREEERREKERREEELKKIEIRNKQTMIEQYKRGEIGMKIVKGNVIFTSSRQTYKRVKPKPIELNENKSSYERNSNILGGSGNSNRRQQIEMQNNRTRLSREIINLEEKNAKLKTKLNSLPSVLSECSYIGTRIYVYRRDTKWYKDLLEFEKKTEAEKKTYKEEYNLNLKLIRDKKIYLQLNRYLNNDIISVILLYI